MSTNLPELLAAANAYTGSWENTQLALDIKMSVFETYDPNDDLIYPTIEHWDLLLLEVMANGSYGKLKKSEVLSILFGIHHRNRIVDGLWDSFLERGVTQKLLGRLLVLDYEQY